MASNSKKLLMTSLVAAMRAMWTDGAERTTTLGRIAVHCRQFEGWWKFASVSVAPNYA